MRLIGGVVQQDRERPVDRTVLAAMAGRVGQARPEILVSGPLGLFQTGDGDAWRTISGTTVGGDLELTGAEALLEPADAGDPVEAIGVLYRREGSRVLGRLRGAFALALWDEPGGELVVAVDQLGIKRLYFAELAGSVVFATRPTMLVGPGGAAREADPDAVFHYLNFGYVPGPGSAFRGVRRLEPGQLMRVRDGVMRLEQYWDLAYSEERVEPRQAAERMYWLVERAVAAALPEASVKESGAFLSGGTDSSTVLGLACKLTGERFGAFSIGFREPRYDELGYAELSARHFGASHHTAVIGADEALETVPQLLASFDEPFGNNSAIGTYLCARLALAAGASRLLAGDGGDEIFGGNERYRTDRIFARYHVIPAVLRRRLVEPALSLWPERLGGPVAKARRYVRRANLPNPRRFYSYSFFFSGEGRRLLAPELLERVAADAPWAVLERHFARAHAPSELNRLLYLDLKLTIADNDLLKVTRTAEAAGVTVRFPLLDLPLVQFTATLPSHLKVRGLEKRYLFKQAFRRLLPAEVLRKQKHGFGVPTSVWLKEHPGFRDLARETLLSGPARARGYFRPGAVEELLALHRNDATAFYGDVLWTVLMLELWHRHWLDGAVAA